MSDKVVQENMNVYKRESGDDMEATMKTEEVRKLNKSKLTGRKRTTMSTEVAIKEIDIFEWAEDVINGTKKAVIDKNYN